MAQPFQLIEAAVATEAKAPFAVQELELTRPGAQELLIKIVASGICHTDVMVKQNGLCAFPIVLGHEGAGVVEAVGEGVTGFAKGDHVVLSFASCGACRACKAGKTPYCHEHGSRNFSGRKPDGSLAHRAAAAEHGPVHGSFFQQSSFATYALAHPSNTVKVDKRLPLQMLAPLGCGVQTGAGTVMNTLSVAPGSTLAVFGCGTVGISAIMAARANGAATVIAVDINDARLAKAVELGAHQSFNPTAFPEPAALTEALRRLGRDGAGVDYAIDTTGIPRVLRQAVDCCGALGTTAMIAPGKPGTEVAIDMLGLLPGKALRGVVQGDSYSPTFIPKLIDLWQAGRFPFDRMITLFHGLHAINEAVAAMESGAVVKPVIVVDPDYA